MTADISPFVDDGEASRLKRQLTILNRAVFGPLPAIGLVVACFVAYEIGGRAPFGLLGAIETVAIFEIVV